MKKPKDSFTGSEKHVLDGIKLEPWTPARVIAAQSMGMLYPQIGKEGWDQFKRTQTYPGSLKDTIICLWLCSVDAERVDDADRGPQEAYSDARAWANRLGIHVIDSIPYWRAYRKFSDIMGEVNSASTRPAKVLKDEGDDGPND